MIFFSGKIISLTIISCDHSSKIVFYNFFWKKNWITNRGSLLHLKQKLTQDWFSDSIQYGAVLCCLVFNLHIYIPSMNFLFLSLPLQLQTNLALRMSELVPLLSLHMSSETNPIAWLFSFSLKLITKLYLRQHAALFELEYVSNNTYFLKRKYI